ncbi:MAG TPA: DUF1572 family protein [Gemmatimonadaceae bacterium]|nr:DUF1572 family protein [Gemmatimonadaceae bacterium]
MAYEDLNMFRDSLRFVMLRDLRALDREIAAYADDASLWVTPLGISNSAGNLALHIAGNLRSFIGAALGNSGYVRDRDAEFSTRNISRAEVRAELAMAVNDLERAFNVMEPSQLSLPFPLRIRDKQVLTADFLTHLAVHLTYHLGQVDYHRRLLTQSQTAVETVSVDALPAFDNRALENSR